MLGLKLIHVNKRGLRKTNIECSYRWQSKNVFWWYGTSRHKDAYIYTPDEYWNPNKSYDYFIAWKQLHFHLTWCMSLKYPFHWYLINIGFRNLKTCCNKHLVSTWSNTVTLILDIHVTEFETVHTSHPSEWYHRDCLSQVSWILPWIPMLFVSKVHLQLWSLH